MARKPSALVKQLPTIIRVGAFDIRLVPMEQHHGDVAEAKGYFDDLRQVIALEAEPASSVIAATVLIHEVQHAIYWAYGLKDQDDEERTVSGMANGWAQVYRDNIWLLGWLKTALS